MITIEDDGGGRVTPMVAERINQAMDAASQRADRIMAYTRKVEDMPGPLGELLRRIGQSHREFVDAESGNGTTLGEYERLESIVDHAMSALDWLHYGEPKCGEPA